MAGVIRVRADRMERGAVYFKYCGEANTEEVLRAVKTRSRDLISGKVVVSSETGRSALKALETFRGAKIKIIVVTHYPAFTPSPKGKIPIGIRREQYAGTLKKLTETGVKIVQGVVPFASPSRSIGWSYTTPECMVDKTLEVFGAGTKIAVEAAIMATDAGEVEEGEEIICCGGTYKGLDTALVVKAAHSMSFFKEFGVREIVAKPLWRVKALRADKFQNWKGDLDKYYV